MNLGRILSLAAIVLVIAWNYIANSLPLNDVAIGTLSEKYSTFLNPAPYAFAIWGAIYLGLLAVGIFQLLPAQRETQWIDDIQPILRINLALNALWLPLFHYELLLPSVICMLALLISLIIIFFRLRRNRRSLPLWVAGVFQIYFGWVFIATIVNVSLYLHHLGMGQTLANERVWYFVLISAGFTIATMLTVRYRLVMFPITIAWALIAIGFDQAGESIALQVAPVILAVALLLSSIVMYQVRK